ncbi:MAG: PHP domain-containing protein [bacterium]|nr:PHP domain-containing protein [bacterium]
MQLYNTDLHIHSCLSPCGDLEMYPRNIVKAAKQKKLDIIGICDHNSCENVPGIIKSAENQELYVIGGMEITTAEDVHILALFEHAEQLLSMQDIVYDNLPGLNNEERFGEQVVVNEDDEVLDFNQRLLIGATELTVEAIVAGIHELHGLAIASHIDREGFGIIGQLGFIPPGLPLDAVEISDSGKFDEFANLGYPVIASSDAHELKNIGCNLIHFFMEAITLAEMKKALLGEDGRRVSF